MRIKIEKNALIKSKPLDSSLLKPGVDYFELPDDGIELEVIGVEGSHSICTVAVWNGQVWERGDRRCNELGINLIKSFENLKLEAYPCPAGVPTIGWGTTKIEGKSIQMGMVITAQQAEEYFQSDLRKAEKIVSTLVTKPLSNNEFAALCSMVQNIGPSCLIQTKSQMARYLESEDYLPAADQILRWDKATVDGAKVALPGLGRRRRAERLLFLTPEYRY